nr:hypothetical protein [Tanacetum cinerariifolium]
MHSLGKTINELHAMLKLHEQNLPKNNAPALHAIRAGQWKRNCPQYLAELLKKKKNAASGAGGSGIFVIELNTILNRSWIYDTGCSTHVCNTTQGLRNSLITQEASGSLEDLEIIQEEDMHHSIDTSLNHEEDDLEIDEPQIELPSNGKTIGSKWLFKKKTNMDRVKHTYKACLVEKGYTQTPWIDYEETFSPVVDIRAIKILITVAAYYDYEIWQMDVKTAFLNGYLNEEVYMEQPEGFVNLKYPNRRYCIENSKRGSIPMQEKINLSKSQAASTPAELKRMQNVSYASANPSDLYWTIVKNIMKYLMNTKDMFLVYGAGYVFILNGGAVDWNSAKKFISGLGVVPTIEEPISMYYDNTGAIAIANESGITKGGRHFRAKVHHLREVIEYGDVKLEKVHTYDNLADAFTKTLAFPKHSEHTRIIGMLSASRLMIVLSIEDKLNYLEQPIPPVPVAHAGQRVAPEILAAHTAWVKGSKEIAGLMLMTMEPEIQRNLEPLHAHEMLKEQEEGQSLSSCVLKMKGYIDNLERLRHLVTLGHGVSLILIGLRKEYDGFVQNYNMHSMGKIVNELHAMLKLHEQTMPQSNAPALNAIRAGKVQKGNKHKKSHSQKGAKGQNQGKGKFVPKPKIPPPPKRENPAKDSICHECGKIGHWKRNCPQYLAELMKKKKKTASGAGGSGIFVIELNAILNRSWIYDT